MQAIARGLRRALHDAASATAVNTMRRGQELGQLRRDVDFYAVVDQHWGACYNRLLNSDLPITPAFADALIDNVWRGVAPLRVTKDLRGPACAAESG